MNFGPTERRESGPDRSGVVTWAPPMGTAASPDYTLSVSGVPVFVYEVNIRQEMVDPPDSILTHEHGGKSERAAFAIFDFAGKAEVTITAAKAPASARIWPTAADIIPQVDGKQIRFQMPEPRHLTLLVGDTDDHVLHLFAAGPEVTVPAADDPLVLYFGPGVHELTELNAGDYKEVYVAGGAVLRAVLPHGARGVRNERTGLLTYGLPIVWAQDVRGLRIHGRGILDGSALPHGSKAIIGIGQSQNIYLGGITLIDSPAWNVAIWESMNVEVDNLRMIGARLNSDGINTVGSENVHIHDCFVRNHDDSIVIKTMNPEKPARHVKVERCTIWNDWGYALGVTYETRADISNVVYKGCDVLFVRFAAFGLRVVDSGIISDITFEDCRVEDLRLSGKRFGKEPQFIYVALTQDMWMTDKESGHIKNLTFRNCTVHGLAPTSTIEGQDAEHVVEGIHFEQLVLAGAHIVDAVGARLTINDHTLGVSFK